MADSNSTSPDDATLKLARCLESMTPSQVGFFTRLVQRLETDHYNALIAALKRDLPMIKAALRESDTGALDLWLVQNSAASLAAGANDPEFQRFIARVIGGVQS